MNDYLKSDFSVTSLASCHRYLAIGSNNLIVAEKSSKKIVSKNFVNFEVQFLTFFHNIDRLLIVKKGTLFVYNFFSKTFISKFEENNPTQNCWKAIITPNNQNVIAPLKYQEIGVFAYDGVNLTKIKTIYQDGAVWDLSYKNGNLFSGTEKGIYSFINNKFQKIKEKAFLTDTAMTSLVHYGDEKLVIGFEENSTLKFFKIKTKSIKEYQSFSDTKGKSMIRNLCVFDHYLLYCSIMSDYNKNLTLQILNMREWTKVELDMNEKVMSIVSDDAYVYVGLESGMVKRIELPQLKKDDFLKSELTKLSNLEFIFN